MIKSSNKIVLKNEEGKTLEIPAESFDVEKYINSTIEGYKYILEIDGNEINFTDSKKRTEFLETINNFYIDEVSKSFNTDELPVVNLWTICESTGDFHEGLAKVQKNGKWGFVNKHGEIIIPCEYDDVGDFHEGLARVQKDGKYGFIDKNGIEVIPCIYNSHCVVGDFHEEMAKVRKNLENGYCIGWSFINKNGEEVISCKYSEVRDFHDGLAAVYYIGEGLKSSWGFINKNGEEIIPCKYKSVSDFHEGLARVQKDGKYGFIDKNGIEVIPCKYDFAGDFHEGLARVQKEGKYGFIDKNGEEVIPCKYKSVSDFHEELANVKKDNALLYIDKTNKVLSLKFIISDIKDILNIPGNYVVMNTEIGYALDFQEDKVLFNSSEEREKFIKLLDGTINIDPDYYPKNLTKNKKINA